ncbi:MAG: hypothetical protein IIY70_03460 [Oscillospiraceae bacterium]|nr:hypothetical protein [Oscillospiraceae bacterium]
MSKCVCGSCKVKYSNKLDNCPNCGALNPAHIPVEAATEYNFRMPKTLRELEQLLEDNRLSPSNIRLHLREDYPGPLCCGIFQDGEGNFVVYKNRIDGSRLVRYRGPDESYAVGELVDKMLEQVEVRRALHVVLPHEQGSMTVQKDSAPKGKKPGRSSGKRRSKIKWNYLGLFSPLLIVLLLWVVMNWNSTKPGYYLYQNSYYYYQDSDWFVYQGDTWFPTVPVFATDSSRYFRSERFSTSFGIADFASSGYYKGNSGNRSASPASAETSASSTEQAE